MQSVMVCVDDDRDLLQSLGQQLRRQFGKDYEVELCSSAREALELCMELTLEGKAIPLVISDQRMPEIQGDALLIQLHQRYPQTLKILLTGQADADSVGNVVNASALYRYIPKPWDETDLLLTVSEALRRFEQDQQLALQHESLKAMNAKLESSLALLMATLDATADGILVLDCAGNVVSYNQRFAQIWGYADACFRCENPQQILAQIFDALTEPDAIAAQALLNQHNTKHQGCLSLKNGQVIEYYLQPQFLDHRIVGCVWSCRDVTQEKQAAALVTHQAFHDALTNLPNRLLFSQKLSEALAKATYHANSIAVMFLDLDRFKAVNDTFGHRVGDYLLQAVVQRLMGCLRKADVLARWGGDEFVLFLPLTHGKAETLDIAPRLINSLQPAFEIEGHTLHISTSVGIALYPGDGMDANALLHNADVAMYQAKKLGRNNFQYFTADSAIAIGRQTVG